MKIKQSKSTLKNYLGFLGGWDISEALYIKAFVYLALVDYLNSKDLIPKDINRKDPNLKNAKPQGAKP